MSMNRKATIAALAALTSVGLAACSGTTTSSAPSSAAPASSSGAAAAFTPTCPTGQLNGGGSSAQALAMSSVIAQYQTKCANTKVNYDGKQGSGTGIKNFYNSQLDWAGSDAAASTKPSSDGTVEMDKIKARCNNNPGWNLPAVVGPVTFAYNLQGVTSLNLNAQVIADIFMGKITTWNDPAIAKLNSGVTLPSTKISVMYRSDSSGTSYNVSDFLNQMAPSTWTTPADKAWKGTAGEGKQGSQGVADGIKSTDGAFGYVEWKYATDSNLGIATVDSGAGPVKLTADAVSKAVSASANVVGTGGDQTVKIDFKAGSATAGAYPMYLITYEIACSAGLDASKTAVEKDFFSYLLSTPVQKSLTDQGYAPLPDSLRTKVQSSVDAIK